MSTGEVSSGLAAARTGLAQAERYRKWSSDVHVACVVSTAVFTGCAVLLTWTFALGALIMGVGIFVTYGDVKRWTTAIHFWEHMIERWERMA